MQVKSIRPITGDDLKRLVRTDEEVYKNAKRQVRAPILKAYDTYRSAVNYGDEVETPAEHESMRAYRRAILDLNEDALLNVPERIEYYK